MSSHPVIHHSALRTAFEGLAHPVSSADTGVWQFRGIKYANIPGRFKQSTLNTTFDSKTNATKYGPKCPQTIYPLRLEDGLIHLPAGVGSHSEDIFDEFSCLNLNITTPAGTKQGDDLPVMVYIHGGGGFSGSNGDWWCDGGSIVKRSVEIGKPIVIVAINYRLTVFGYMGSSELLEENGVSNGGNYGLRDQHTAIAWLTEHISPFGGSPTNLTLYGESAGSSGIHAHIHSLIPLPSAVKHCIMQSQQIGAPGFSAPQTIAEKSTLYNAVKEKLDIKTVKELEEVKWEDLLKVYQSSDPRNGVGDVAMFDDVFLSENWKETFGWKGDVVIGTMGKEGAVIEFVFLGFPTTTPRPPISALFAALNSVVSAEKANSLLGEYNITAEINEKDAAEELVNLLEDLTFYHTPRQAANRFRKQGMRVSEYVVLEKNPFQGMFEGVSCHALDLAYLQGDPNIFAGTKQEVNARELANKLKDTWIGISYGESGWEQMMKFGPAGGVEELDREKWWVEGRRGGKWDVFNQLSNEEAGGVVMVLAGFLGMLIGKG